MRNSLVRIGAALLVVSIMGNFMSGYARTPANKKIEEKAAKAIPKRSDIGVPSPVADDTPINPSLSNNGKCDSTAIKISPNTSGRHRKSFR